MCARLCLKELMFILYGKNVGNNKHTQENQIKSFPLVFRECVLFNGTAFQRNTVVDADRFDSLIRNFIIILNDKGKKVKSTKNLSPDNTMYKLRMLPGMSTHILMPCDFNRTFMALKRFNHKSHKQH